jgi:hypothetical protein
MRRISAATRSSPAAAVSSDDGNDRRLTLRRCPAAFSVDHAHRPAATNATTTTIHNTAETTPTTSPTTTPSREVSRSLLASDYEYMRATAADAVMLTRATAASYSAWSAPAAWPLARSTRPERSWIAAVRA